MSGEEADKVQGPEGQPFRPKPRFSRARRTSVWTLRLLIFVGSVLVLGAVFSIGKVVSAPDWLRDRVETRIQQNLGGMQLRFGDLQFVLLKGLRPRVLLQNLELDAPDGRPVLRLSSAEASLSMEALTQGKIQPRRIRLTEAVALLSRAKDGSLSIALGGDPMERAPSLPELVERLDAVFLSPQLSSLYAVEMEALTLRFEDARAGRAWTLDGGRVNMQRADENLRVSAGFSVLGGLDVAGAVEANYTSRLDGPAAEFGINVTDIPAQDIASQSVAFGWVSALRAPISGALRGSVDGQGGLGPISATLQIGAGAVRPNEGTRPIPFREARTYLTFRPDQGVLEFSEISVDSGWLSGIAEGRAYLGGVEQGQLTDLVAQLRVENLRVSPPGVYEQPLTLSGTTDFSLELAPFRFRLGQMTVSDGTTTVHMDGEVLAQPNGWQLAADLGIDSLTPEHLITLWPEALAPKPRKWVADNLTGGDLHGVDVGLRLAPGEKLRLAGDFSFEDTSIRYVKTMPPITGATGQVTLFGTRFAVSLSEGQVQPFQGGPIDVKGSSFIIPDLGIPKAAPGVARLQVEGDVTAAMAMLNTHPLKVLKDTPLPIALADGQARASGLLALPLKKKVPIEEIKFHFDGTLENMSSDVLVPGQVLRAGQLRVRGDQSGVEISGNGQVGDVPATATWRQPIGPGAPKASRVEGEVELSQVLVDTFGIGLPDGTVNGAGPGQFTLDLAPKSPPVVKVSSTLEGVGLRMAPLGWSKPASTTGLFELTGVLGERAEVQRLVLQASGLSLTGTVLNRVGGGLERAVLSSVRLGGWLDAAVQLTGRGDAPPSINVLSGRVDLRKADFGTSGGSSSQGQSGPLRVSLQNLQITDSLSLRNFQGEFSTARGLDGPFSGQVNGQTTVTGRVVPEAGRTAVQIQSEDAGGVFRSAGILTQGQGGSFNMTLRPVGAASYDGSLQVRNARIKDAPVMAALLNAVSIVGLVDEMAGQGILFTSAESTFRIDPGKLSILSGSAVGPSIGLSMDGTYDTVKDWLAMRGVISPVYMLNVIGSVLTRKGEGMIGFTYTLAGPASDPSVQVNPLSGLAPGMFREIFREDAPEAPQPGQPVKQREPRKPAAGGDR
ncbi:DUF3971 domain-containing protein [Primorskyibacter sp. S87]|uniref:YhdP family protein n=1 Tax=Primorskyibacter sp. S87 TaxID=3415126 RepID=UPI003C7D4F3B